MTDRTRIPSHVCTDEELGLEGDPNKAVFMPVKPTSQSEAEFYRKKMQCVDTTLYTIHGDFNSYKGNQLNI